jgi:hypothetical protein
MGSPANGLYTLVWTEKSGARIAREVRALVIRR